MQKNLRIGVLVIAVGVLLLAGCMNQEEGTVQQPGAEIPEEEPEQIPEGKATISYYNINVTPSLKDRTLSVTAELIIDIPPGVSIITFSLDAGLYVSKITDETGSELTFYRESNLVKVEVPSSAEKTLVFFYKGAVYRRVRGYTWNYVGEEGCWVSRYNWYPLVATFTEEGYQIYYTWDTSTWAGVTIAVEVPESWTVISSGELISKEPHETSTIWVHEEKRPLPFVSFAAGEFHVTTTEWEGKEIVWCLTEHRDDAQKYTDLTQEILAFYTEKFGEYPFSRLSFVELPESYGLTEAKPWFGMLNSTFLEGEDQEISHILGQIIATQWWPFTVWGNDAPSYYTFSVSLPQYASLLFIKETYGKDTFCDMLSDLRTEVEEAFAQHKSASMTDVGNLNPDLNQAVTLKTLLMFHALKEEMGDDSFFAALKEVFAQHKHTGITIETLIEALQQKSEGNINLLFQKYYYGTEIPPIECD
ncbi:MAG: hypothetical protein HXS46_09935 [Theionarchaea archaeon]|nr:MAG: hypothetical protein AYK18_01130 [Theionarchaea archaeon DG-70]MBU7010999.1 hypothetical protein [Theionarchaea archaeon]